MANKAQITPFEYSGTCHPKSLTPKLKFYEALVMSLCSCFRSTLFVSRSEYSPLPVAMMYDCISPLDRDGPRVFDVYAQDQRVCSAPLANLWQVHVRAKSKIRILGLTCLSTAIGTQRSPVQSSLRRFPRTMRNLVYSASLPAVPVSNFSSYTILKVCALGIASEPN